MNNISLDIFAKVKENNSLAEKYDYWLTHDYIDKQYRDYSYYHPSDLGYCIRKSIMNRINFPGHYYTLARLQRIFKNGHDTHARLQKHFGEMGILYGIWECSNCEFLIGTDSKIGVLKPSDCPNCNNPKKTKLVVDNLGNLIRGSESLFYYKELPVINEKLDIHGNTDGVILLNNELYVIDFKTCSNYAFKKICGEIKNNDSFCLPIIQPIEAHVFQINIYMFILGVPKGFLFYEDRDKMNHKVFELELDENIIKEVLTRMLIGNESLINNTLPEIPDDLKWQSYESTDKLSLYCKGFPGMPPCQFFYHCHPEGWLKLGGEQQYKKFVKINKNIYND